MNSLKAVCLIAEAPFLLVVHPSLPVKNAQELAALARTRPGQLNYGATSIGGLPHLAGELFNIMNKVKLVAIPYKGGAPATMDLLAGLNSEVMARLNTDIGRGMRDAVVVKRLAVEGVDAASSTPEEFAARVKSEIDKWGKVVRAAGMKPE